MSYSRGLGLPNIAPTTLFAEAVDPYAMRSSPPGSIYSPYGWGPDFNYGMPMNYTHHLDYVREPVPGARRIGPMYDRLSGLGAYESDRRVRASRINAFMPRWPQVPITWRGDVNYVFARRLPGGGLGGMLAVL